MLEPATRYRVVEVRMSKTDQKAHEYVLELAEPEQIRFSGVEGQIIKAARFELDEIIKWKGHEEVYMVVGRGIRVTKEGQSFAKSVNLGMPAPAGEGWMTQQVGSTTMREGAAMNSENWQVRATVRIRDEVGLEVEVDEDELDAASEREGASWFPG